MRRGVAVGAVGARTLRAVGKLLAARGFRAESREPDGDDPLGGVIDVATPAGLVQIDSLKSQYP